jgi:protein-disulfide isomerase
MLERLASLVRRYVPAHFRTRRIGGWAILAVLVCGGLFYEFGGSIWRGSHASHVALEPADNVRGNANARIDIVEYTALDCVECARFEKDVFRPLLSRYVDTGLAKFTLKTFAPDDAARDAAAIARCVRQDDYFAFVDLLFRRRNVWAESGDPQQGLVQLAGLAGLPPDRAEACLADGAIMKDIVATTEQARSLYGMTTVPILVINGQAFRGALDWQDLQGYLDRIISRH